jgi:hypothetical protein
MIFIRLRQQVCRDTLRFTPPFPGITITAFKQDTLQVQLLGISERDDKTLLWLAGKIVALFSFMLVGGE